MYEELNPMYYYQEDIRNELNDFFSLKDITTYGNILKSQYVPYKNYKPSELNYVNNKEQLMLELIYLDNAKHDISLLLDIYPENQEYIKIFEDYCMKAKLKRKEYIEKYNPISPCEGKNRDGYYSFVTTPSPWIKGD